MKTINFQFQFSDEELKALERFSETCEDGEGYDIPKPMMKRLAAYGLVRRSAGNIYEITKLGEASLEQLASLTGASDSSALCRFKRPDGLSFLEKNGDGGKPLYPNPGYHWPKPAAGDGTWEIDPRYLRKLQNAMTDDFRPSMENIEAVLLALTDCAEIICVQVEAG